MALSDFIYDCLRRIKARGIVETSSGFEAYCPFCGNTSKRTFRVSERSSQRGKNWGRMGAWTCLRPTCEANRGGYLESLVMRAFRVDYDKAKEIVQDRKGLMIVKRDEEEYISDEVDVAEVYPYLNKPCRYLLEDRGYRQEDLNFYDVGYNKEKDEIVIPTYDLTGKLVGKTTRPARPGGLYIHSKFKKTHHLWGLHQVLRDAPEDSLTLCEGQLDPVGLRPFWEIPAVAQLGSALASEQMDLIIGAGIRTLYLAFDNDKAGIQATWKAIMQAREKGFGEIYVLLYNASDPGTLPVTEGADVYDAVRSSRWIATLGRN